MKKLLLAMLLLVGCATTARKHADEMAEYHPNLIIMYEADWCPACQQLKPVLNKIAKELNVVVMHVNVDNYKADDEQTNMTALGYYMPFIPVLSVYKNGVLYYHGPAIDAQLIFLPFLKD